MNDLINKRKKLMAKLHDSVDYNNLYFKYVSRGKDVSFYKYKDSRELFNAIKNSQIKLTDEKNSQDEFLSKLNNIRIGRKTLGQEKILIILKDFTFLEKKLLIFLETILKCYLMQITVLNKMRLKEQDLKY